MGQANASLAASAGEDLVVLIAGSDPDGDAFCTALAARGADVQLLSAALAVDAIATSNPDVVFLVGDAARQRGALIRSQLVRRMRGTEVNLVVLTENEATQSPNSALRMIPRSLGVEAVAEQLMTLAATASAARSKGTLDQVASMVTAALERPSQPPPRIGTAAPSHIVMEAKRPTPVAARNTIRVPGAIPAPTTVAPARKTPEAQLSMPPPTSLQAMAARRIEITRVNNPPPPLPETTEVSLSDMRIETDRVSGEVSLRAPVPPLPVTSSVRSTPTFEPSTTLADEGARANPTPVAWSPEPHDEWSVPRKRSVLSGRTGWAAALAVAACGGLIAWSALSGEGSKVSPPTVSSTAADHSGTVAAHQTPAPPTTRTETNAPARLAHEETGAGEHEDGPPEALVATALAGDEAGDSEDPAGDEPHLVRARQLCNEGHALRSRGRLGLAEAKYLQAIGLFPEYPRAIAGVVRVHLTRGDGAEAVRWAERLVAMQPNRSNNQLLLGDAYSLSGKATDARRHWRKSASYGNMAARKRLKSDETALAKPTR